MSIRTVLALSIGGLLSLAVLATGGLMLFTIHLHDESGVWASAAAGIQIAEEIELDLLRLNRLRGPATPEVSADVQQERAQLVRDLRQRLADAGSAAGGARERQIVSRASQAVEAYVASGSDGALAERRLSAAVAALGELVAFNVAEADIANVQVARWNRLADAMAATAGCLLMVGIVGTLAWLRVAAFTPLFDLRHAIEKFSGGDAAARARESGPSEIREIAKAFNLMAEELAAHTQRQFTFLAGVAHDLRTPLGPLKLAADMGRRPDALLDVRQAHRMFDIVGRQVEQLERMTGDLLEAARIEGGRLDIRPEPCDLRAIAETVVDLFSGSSATHRLDLILPESPVSVCCDALRIQQVLTNLVSNAVKYSPDGGTVTITVRDDAREAVVAVTDEGLGIAREDLPHIFEPFRRAASVESTIAGVGVGLSISRRLVQAHGGRLEVVSLIGVGSTFTITLPAEMGSPAGGPVSVGGNG